MSVYYNDNEPYVVEWLKNLVAAGHLPQGDVDDRPIQEVQPADVAGYTQCHFFAGIGGWALALQLAGWPTDRPVWTGSCPCQPFSAAGKRKGTTDERHLWPEWQRLISECRPATVFGEQVASPLGRTWLAAVQTDLEALGYATAGADLCAAGVGAPHIRQRLWFVGYSKDRWRRRQSGAQRSFWSSKVGELAHPGCQRCDGQPVCVCQRSEEQEDIETPWSGATFLSCRDGKARPTEPSTFPLADGVPARVGRLRAYGNAIVPQVAAAFIEAALDSTAQPCYI